MALLTLGCALGGVAGAAQETKESGAKERAKAVKELVDTAEGLPIEFRADIQLHAVESGALAPGEAAEGVLERLIESAGTAKNAYPLARALLTADTLENRLADATHDLNHLDALAIQERSIAALAKINRAKALRALREVRVRVPETPCAAAVIPDVTEYYGQLESLAAAAFSVAETNKGENISWYEDNVRGMSSALQLIPMAEFVAHATATETFGTSAAARRERFERLSSRYSSVLETLWATDRELVWLEREGKLTQAILDLASRRKVQGLSADVLLGSYRDFLVRSSQEIPCGDITADWKAIMAAFNQAREVLNLSERVPALTADDLGHESSQGEQAQMTPMPDTGEFYRLFGKTYALRAKASGNAPAAEMAVDTNQWESESAELLNKLDGYDPAKADCAECAYIAKSEVMMGMFDFCPDEAYKRKILSRMVHSLATSPLQTEEPLEWLFQLKLLLNLGRKADGEQARDLQELADAGQVLTMMPSSLGKEIGEEMKQSGDYTMNLFVQADELLGAKYYLPYLKEAAEEVRRRNGAEE
jgi:hypothetical protein